MLPIGTLVRNLHIRLGDNIKYQSRLYNNSPWFFKHDVCGHILGGALLTNEGEGLAAKFETVLHPNFQGGEERIVEVLAEDIPSGFGPSLSDAEIDTYASMLLYYRAVYRMDGTTQLVDKLLNSPKVKGKI